MAPITAVEILGELQKSAPDLQKLRDRIEEDVPAADRTAVFEGVAVKLAALQPTERTLVQKNLLELEKKTARNNARASLDALKIAVNSAPVAAPAAPAASPVAPVKPEGLGTSVGNALEGVANTVLPQRMTANMSRNQKIAAVAVGTLGIAVAVAALWKGWKGVKKTLVWGGAAIAGGLGITWLMDKISLAGGLKAAGKQAMEEMQKQLDETQDMLAPWKKYGLDKDQYEKAEKIYEDNPEHVAEPRILAIFGGRRSLQFEKFMKDMGVKNERREEAGITYRRADVAITNYEKNMESALVSLSQWVERHAVTVGITTFVAYKLGVLQTILRSSLTLGQKILQIGKALVGFGIESPIKFLFLAAGTAVGSLGAAKRTFIPENLKALMNVCVNNGSMLLGDTVPAVTPVLQEIKSYGSQIGGAIDAFEPWVTTQISSVVKELDTSIPETVGLTDDEIIVNRNVACIEELRKDLKARAINAPTDTAAVQARMPAKFARAQEALEIYQQELILERFILKSDSDKPEKALQELIAALKDVDVTMTVEDGVVRWKPMGGTETLDFSIDPALRDRKKMRETSDSLWHGEEDSQYAINKALEELQYQAQHNADKFGTLMGSKGLAMIAGAFVYFIEFDKPYTGFLDFQNVTKWAMAPIHIVKGVFSEDKKEWYASIATGFVATGMFSLNAAAIGALKKGIVGGGPILKGLKTRAVLGCIPGVAHYRFVRDVYRGAQDIAILKRFGYFECRLINSACAHAGIRPEWIRTIDAATDYDSLLKFAADNALLADEKIYKDLPSLKAALKNAVVERLGTIKFRNFRRLASWKFWNAFKEGSTGGAEFFDFVAAGWRTNGATGASAAPASTVNASKTKAAADEELLKKALAKFTTSGSTASLDFLKLADADGVLKLNPDVLALVKQSPGAQKILDGALAAAKGGDFSELTRAMKAANVARNWRIGLNGVGVVGDIFGIAMAMADFKENGCKIEQARQTQNQALIDLYSQMRVVNAVEGASSAASLGVGVTVMVQAYWGGQSIMTAISASGGLIMLPVAVAVAGGGYMARKAAEVTEKWSRTSKDWVQVLSPGEILQKLDEIGPGQRNNKSFFGAIDWDEWGKSTLVEQGARKAFSSRESYEQWEKQGEGTIESANNGARYELTKAYVIHSSSIACQPEPGEADDVYEKRFDQFVIDQMFFIGNVTQGDFSRLLGDMYEQCRVHAELKAKSRKLRAEGKTDVIEWIDAEGEKRSFDFANYEDTKYVGDKDQPSQMSLIGRANERSKSMAAFQIVMMTNMAPDMPEIEKKSMVKQQLVLHIQESINKLNGRIENTDFNGVMGWDTWGKGAARMAFLQLLDEKLEEVSGSLLGKITTKDGLGIADMDAAIQTLRGFCDEQDILKFQAIADDREIVKKGEMLDPTKAKGMLSVQGVLTRVVSGVQERQVEKKREQEKQTMTPQEIAAKRKESGETYLFQNQITNKGDYSQVQFGQWFNKYLYMKFIDDTWQVSFGNYGNGPWKDPDTISVSVGNEDTTGKYNKIIWELAKINSMYR